MLIWLAYFAIPVALASFAWPRRRSLPHQAVLWLFAAFVFSCGLTHLLEAVTFYTPIYRLSGLVKLVTAMISWATVLYLVPVARTAAGLDWTVTPPPSPADTVPRPWQNPYVVAVLAVVLATCARQALSPLMGEHSPFLAYVVAVTAVAWYGGFGPSLLAVLLSGACAWLFLLGTPWTWDVGDREEALGLSLFLFVGVSTGLMAESLRAARRRAEASAQELLEHRRALEAEVVRRKQAQADLEALNATLEDRVAERTAAAEAERRLLDAVLEALPVAVIIAEANGRIVRVNRAGDQVWGPAPLSGSIAEYGEWVGYWPATGKRIAPEEWAMSRALLLGEECPGELVEFERFGDRSRRFIMNSASPVRGADGAVAAGVVASMDVTDRVATEAALRQSEANLNRAQAVAHVGSWALDVPRNELTCSDEACRIFGLPCAEPLTYERFLAVVHPDDRASVDQSWQAAMKGSPYDLEHRLLVDGTVKWVRQKADVELDAEGNAVRGIGITQDVTELKEAQQALLGRTEALERSNQELEQFAYVASHDLQEPLRMVSSYVELLSKRYQGQLDERADKYIHYAVDGAARMQRLIQDLLTYSRVTTRGKPPEPADSGAALRGALANLRKAVEEAGAVVTHDQLPTVRADATQLTQVFQNLIGNALKFCAGSPPRVHVGCQRQGSDWLFSVRDNGIGIAPEHADRIFLLFQRLHQRDKYPGTGIGLAICKKVVERHGGRIWVESSPGRGSTFFFTFPTAAEGRHDHGGGNGQTG